MWVRGLKPKKQLKRLRARNVAPYVGAWIETTDKQTIEQQERVAPYVGAWIETPEDEENTDSFESHPMWVRGLKLKSLHKQKIVRSRTLCGCVD